MENGECSEQKMLMYHELCQGMELAKQLVGCLNATDAESVEKREILLRGVLSSFERTSTMLNWNDGMAIEQQTQSPVLVNTAPECSLSRDESPRSENCDVLSKENQNATPKKRKFMPTWTDKVRVNSDNGYEGPIDDGYSWRKYGQKDILGAKFPRSYYRCTYRGTQNCWATKQVQRSDNDTSVFEIIYKGKHNCNQNISPKKTPKQNKSNLLNITQSNNLLLNFKTNLTVETKGSESGETEPHFTFPYPSFGWVEDKAENFSPTFEGIYDFYLSQEQMDFNEIISTNTSASNSPILDLDLDFTIDPVHLDPCFPFDTPGFFD